MREAVLRNTPSGADVDAMVQRRFRDVDGIQAALQAQSRKAPPPEAAGPPAPLGGMGSPSPRQPRELRPRPPLSSSGDPATSRPSTAFAKPN